jgi:hypothetical protein
MLGFLLSSILLFLPQEYVIDCSGWTGASAAEVTYYYECWDGNKLSSRVELSLRSSPQLAVDAFTTYMEMNLWRFEKEGKPGDEAVFIIRGSTTSPIRRVVFKGDVWVPGVQQRIAQPSKEGPKK